jgi:S1-C subfamily serine protease
MPHGGVAKPEFLPCLHTLTLAVLVAGCSLLPSGFGLPSRQQPEVLGTKCPGTSVWTGQGCTTPTPSTAAGQGKTVEGNRTDSESGTVADDRAGKIRDLARSALATRGISAAYPCDDGWMATPAGWIIDVTAWAEAAGLRRGDRIVGIGDVSTAEAGDWGEGLARLPRTERFSMRVDRRGQTVEVVLPCRDNTRAWNERRHMYDAMAAGRWSDCMDAASRMDQIVSRLFGLKARWECWRAKIVEERAQPPREFWIATHDLLTRELEAAKYAPGQLSDIRSRVLEGIQILEQRGLPQYADDLRAQLQSVASPPQEEVAPKQESAKKFLRSGTAFAVRPDGVLVTAFHVVESADVVVVACQDKKPVVVEIQAASSTTDLAVLKARELVTPDYLSFADPRAAGIGMKVFTVGYPAPDLLGRDAKFTEGVVSSLSGPGGDASFLQITVPAHGGNSGGALVNEQGEVVGVVIATASAPSFLKATGALPQNVNWAVKGAYVSAMFDAPSRLRVAQDRSRAIQRTIRATCLVVAEGQEHQK